MTENSTAGLTMLDAERSVVVTGEERHQDVLGGLAPGRGAPAASPSSWCRSDPDERRASTVSGWVS